MITRATAVSGAAALILGWMGFATMNDEPSANPNAGPPPPQRVSVRLLGPAKGITGVAVPAHILAGERPRFFQIAEPSVIVVALPEEREVMLPVKTAFINTEVDVKTKTAIVVDIDLLPLPKSVPYREAVAELRRLMREMGVEPDERMRKQMSQWPDDSGPITYRAGMWLSESIGLGVELRPADDGEWFLVLTFAASSDAVRPLWDPNFKPPAEEKRKKPNPDSGEQ